MSDNSHNFDDNFDDNLDDLLSQTIVVNEDIFGKLFSNRFEDESILLELSTNESLPQNILNFENYCNRDNRSNDLFFDYISGLNNLIQKLSHIEDEAIIELWISSPKQTENCILSTVFKFLPNCYIQVCEPKTMDFSKFAPNSRITFFESIALNICQLVITLSQTHFQSVEPFFIRQLLSEQSVCSLLASDVLCFAARVSKSPLCYQLCSVLMTISSHINDSKLPNICSLINRLIPFLKDIELEYLLKDYDLLTHSRVWRIPNIYCVLSAQQIRDSFDKFKALIEDGKPLSKYNINVLKYLLMTDESDKSSREYYFELFWKNFLSLRDPNLYSEFIDVLSVLLPNRLSDSFIEKTFNKINLILDTIKQNNTIALDLAFIEKILMFFVRLSISDVSDPMEKLMTKMISSYVYFFYKNSTNFYTKYLIFKTLKEISLKSKLISIVDKCCSFDQDFKEEFVLYLQKIKTSQVMDENEKLDYLQTIESNLRNQSDFKTNEIVVKNNNHMNEEISVEVDNNFDELFPKDIGSENHMINGFIDTIQQNVRNLKQNQSLLNSNHKKDLFSAFSEFKDFVEKL